MLECIRTGFKITTKQLGQGFILKFRAEIADLNTSSASHTFFACPLEVTFHWVSFCSEVLEQHGKSLTCYKALLCRRISCRQHHEDSTILTIVTTTIINMFIIIIHTTFILIPVCASDWSSRPGTPVPDGRGCGPKRLACTKEAVLAIDYTIRGLGV